MYEMKIDDVRRLWRWMRMWKGAGIALFLIGLISCIGSVFTTQGVFLLIFAAGIMLFFSGYVILVVELDFEERVLRFPIHKVPRRYRREGE